MGVIKMKEWTMIDSISRTMKILMDEGKVSTLWEAQKLLESYRIAIVVGPEIAHSSTLQAMLLTIVNTGRRCFWGGIYVKGPVDTQLLVPWRTCHTLSDAILDLQGHITSDVDPEIPQIIVGDISLMRTSEFALRATFNGWSGGVVPLEDDIRLPEDRECTPAGVLAGALAVSEAFQYMRGDTVIAGRRQVGMSLWQPGPNIPWLIEHDPGPPIELLPSKLWLIGLGHLGQAYLWTLGFLPYKNPENVRLILQDFDALVPANESTSPLTFDIILGQKKTRAMAIWCEKRGFQTSINERFFSDDFQISPHEPSVALCGVDNAVTRAALEDVGFKRVIEAGFGRGIQECLAFQMHTFPSQQSARNRWGNSESLLDNSPEHEPAYKNLAAEGLDQCGVTTLAGRSVGASFVGAVVSAIVIAETLRMTIGAQRYSLIDGSLRSLEHRQTVMVDDQEPFNPGSTGVTQV